MKRVAERMAHVGHSGTLSVADRVRELKRQGADIIDFSNRVATPEPIREAAMKAINEPWVSAYTDTAGLFELRQDVARSMDLNCGIKVDPETELLITVGGKEGIFAALFATINPGDEVLIPDPSWVTYDPCVGFAGGIPVSVPTNADQGFSLNPSDLEAAVTPRTRMIVLNTPHNPTGVVLRRETLEAVADIARRHDLLVMSDECYYNYVYDNHPHVSIASLPGMTDRTLTVQTTTKIFNMFGWRVGWVSGPADIISQTLKVHQHIVACAATISQAGAVAAVNLPAPDIRSIVETYRETRSVMVKELNDIQGLSVHVPEGAYFLFPSIKGLGMTSIEASHFMLEKANVLTFPGSSFGRNGEGFIRLNFTCPVNVGRRAVARIREAVEKL